MPITIGSYPILDEENPQSSSIEPSRRGDMPPAPVSIGPIVQQPISVSAIAINIPSAPVVYPEAASAPLIPTAPYPEEGKQ